MDVTKTARVRSRPLIAGMVAVVLLAAVVLFVLPRVVDYGQVWDALTVISWPWMVILIAAAALNVVTFAPPLMAALPGIGFRPALTVTLSSTASTYVAPGGPAVGMALSFAMLRGWGFGSGPVTLAVAVSTVWNLFVTFGVPAIALALLTAAGGSHPLLRTAAVVGLIIFAALLAGFGGVMGGRRPARWLGDVSAGVFSRLLRVAGRGPVAWSGESFLEFRADAIGLLRARWHWISAATLAGHLTVYLVLILTLRAVGIERDEVGYAESFAAWSIVRVLAAIPITPGGFGVVELGLTGALLAFGGPQAEVVGAVLVYRFLTVGPPLLVGALSAATWRRHHADWAPPDDPETAPVT